MRNGFLLAVVGTLVVGCASYTARELPAPDARSFSTTAERAEVTVSADAYSDTDRQMAYLGEDLGAAGAFPVRVLIQNKGDVPRLVQPEGFRLRLPDGDTVTPSPPHVVAVLFDKRRGSELDVAASAFGLLGAFGALATLQADDDARNARSADYYKKALKPNVLKPGESSHGFLFFVLSRKTARFTEITVEVHLPDPQGANAMSMDLVIKNVQFPSFSTGKE